MGQTKNTGFSKLFIIYQKSKFVFKVSLKSWDKFNNFSLQNFNLINNFEKIKNYSVRKPGQQVINSIPN